MRCAFVMIVFSLVVSGCSTMTPARYSVSADANQQLKQYRETQGAYLASLAAPPNYDANCRLMGPIRAGDGLTIPQFVQKAFNDEFKFADIHNPTGAPR